MSSFSNVRTKWPRRVVCLTRKSFSGIAHFRSTSFPVDGRSLSSGSGWMSDASSASMKLRESTLNFKKWASHELILVMWHHAIRVLTHLPMDKMAAILVDEIFNWIFLNGNDWIPIQISLKCVSRSPIENKPALVHVMAWRRTGDKPLPEPMLT